MDGHLVPVEVGVEGRADERVQPDGLAFDELRLKGLDAEAVKGRRAVEQHRVLLDDLFEHVPDLGALPVDEALGRLDVFGDVKVDEALLDERLEQLQSHDRGQAALVQLEVRADDDDRTARVVHSLAQQVLAETALLALEHVGKRLERAVAGALDGAAAAAVVEQRVDGLLEHPLLVVDHDLGRAQVEHALEAVVAVDHAPVEVVEVRGREASAVELDHRAQIRGDDRQGVEDHGRGLRARVQEGVDHLDALERAGLALGRAALDGLDEQVALAFQVEGFEPALDSLGPAESLKIVGVTRLHLAVEVLVAFEVAHLELGETLPHRVEAEDVGLRALADAGEVGFGGSLDARLRLGLLTLVLGLQKVGFELPLAVFEVDGEGLLDRRALKLVLGLQRGKVLAASLLVHRSHHVGGEVDDLFEVLGGDVEQVPQTRGNALEIPDMGDGGREFDVAHALATHLGARDFHAAAFAHDPLESRALVLAAGALPIARGAEDPLAEEPVSFGLECAVVDGLGLLHLAVRPGADVVRGCE